MGAANHPTFAVDRAFEVAGAGAHVGNAGQLGSAVGRQAVKERDEAAASHFSRGMRDGTRFRVPCENSRTGGGSGGTVV